MLDQPGRPSQMKEIQLPFEQLELRKGCFLGPLILFPILWWLIQRAGAPTVPAPASTLAPLH